MTTTAIEQRECTECTKCSIARPRTHEWFPANKRMADGLSSWCREWPSNLRPACGSCNSAKGGKHPKSLIRRS